MADLIDLTALKSPTTILAPTDTSDVIKTTITITGIAGKYTLSGGLTADTYKEIASFSVPGTLRLCGMRTEDATSRTIGLKIVIDGRTVFDSVSPTMTTIREGFFAVGGSFGIITTAAAVIAFENIRFNASLSVQIKSSLTETDKISLIHATTV